ncbi:MAG: c-type cytochrome [Rhodospirillaceae bacterium]
MAVTFRSAPLALALIAAVGLSDISRASAAEAQRGPTVVAKNVIQNICARCHDTSPELKTVPPRQPGVAPAFLTIAADPKISRVRLLKFLRFPHGDMDNVFLTRRETADVADYILSLRK